MAFKEEEERDLLLSDSHFALSLSLFLCLCLSFPLHIHVFRKGYVSTEQDEIATFKSRERVSEWKLQDLDLGLRNL